MEMEMERMMILEINLISAQNLKNHRPHMHTYALAWVDPRHKLRGDLDPIGGVNPTWNDKFIFRVSQPFIDGDTSAVQFHIYAVGFIRDYFIGTVRYLLSSSSNPPIRSSSSVTGVPSFSALHIRRPSGRVHGVLNIAATLYNTCDFPCFTADAICFRDLIRLKKNMGEGKVSRYLRGLKASSSYNELSETSSDDQEDSDDCSSEESTQETSMNVMAGNKSNGFLCIMSPSLRNLFNFKIKDLF